MKVPRLKIGWVMVFVAILAFDFGMIRAISLLKLMLAEPLGLGALPMAHILTLAGLIGLRSRECRPFLSGFLAFGGTGLCAYVAWACLGGDSLDRTLHPIFEPIGSYFRRTIPRWNLVVSYGAAVVLLTLTQLAFALAGGLLCRKFGTSPASDDPKEP